MGFFSGGGNSGAQDSAQMQSNALIDRQFNENQAEIETKRKSIAQQRMEIIKSQGGQIWHPRDGSQ